VTAGIETGYNVNIESQIDIKAPPERVFELVSDIDRMPQWMDNLLESEYLSVFDPVRAIGTGFRQRASEMGREFIYEGRITAYDPPSKFAISVESKEFALEIKINIMPTKDGSKLEYKAEMTRASFKIRLLASAFTSVAEKTLARQLANLKKLAES
jgi:uncharacterized protein YndB with AHSA1/START domain